MGFARLCHVSWAWLSSRHCNLGVAGSFLFRPPALSICLRSWFSCSIWGLYLRGWVLQCVPLFVMWVVPNACQALEHQA